MHRIISDVVLDDARIVDQIVGEEKICHAEFDHCEFEKVSFKESKLYACTFRKCVFIRCDFSMTSLEDCRISGSKFRKSTLIGINWTTLNWNVGMQSPFLFSECTLNHSTFLGMNMEKWSFKDCNAIDVDFREAVLREAKFPGTDLRDGLFHHTDLRKSDLSRARNYRIAAAENQLEGAKFSLPEAMSLLDDLGIELIAGIE